MARPTDEITFRPEGEARLNGRAELAGACYVAAGDNAESPRSLQHQSLGQLRAWLHLCSLAACSSLCLLAATSLVLWGPSSPVIKMDVDKRDMTMLHSQSGMPD